MQVTKETTSPTAIKLTFTADATELDQMKQVVLKRLAKTVKMQGFRLHLGKIHAPGDVFLFWSPTSKEVKYDNKN